MLLFYGLIVYTLSVYGIAWLITQSYIFEGFRSSIEDLAHQREGKLGGGFLQKISYLFGCIVCTSVWIGVLLALGSNHSLLLSEAFPPVNILDLFIWAGWSASTSWMLANLLDDAG